MDSMRKKSIIILGIAVAIISLSFYIGSQKKGHTPVSASKVSNILTSQPENDDRERQIAEYQEKYSLNNKSAKYDDFMIQAKSGIVVDAQTGKILYAKGEHKKLAPASITKVMTAVIALENIDIKKRIEISERASKMEPFKVGMSVGEKIETKDLLYAAMMISANDAAEALAEGIDGRKETCVDKMNEKAELLDLKETHFENACGLDAKEHTSSAHDMAKLTYYALKVHPDILKYMGDKKPYSIMKSRENDAHYWYGHVSQTLNAFPEVIGAKTGFTDNARNTFIGVAQKDGRKFIFVFMGSDRGMEDAKTLLNFGLKKI